MMRFILLLGSSLLMALFVTGAKAEQPNVLLIFVDDLRPELGCYGKDYIHSPHIDALAQKGVLFERHFVQAPTCGASRYAMLTGCYGSPGNGALFKRAKQVAQAKPSLPAWFRENGYTTVSVGKVSHHPGGRGGKDWNDEEELEMPNSWNRHLLPAGAWLHPRGWMHGLANGEIRKNTKEMDVFQAEEGEDSLYPDGVMIPVAIEQLKNLAKEEKPFFLAVGILRPHLPFGAPQKYLEPYEKTEFPPIPHPKKPQGRTTWHGSGEFMKYHRWGKNPNDDAEFATEVRRHYAACVSYADAMVGKAMTALEQSGEADNTIVILWGDHGWHLGEHGVWGKHTLFEESLRSPLIVVSPKGKAMRGRASQIVQSVDVYPTLCEMAGLEAPEGLSGQSLVPLLKRPSLEESRGYAISYHGSGATIRTEGYRLITHKDGYNELYELQTEEGEAVNLAASHPNEVEELKRKLQQLRGGGE